jgi:hypothetical protein
MFCEHWRRERHQFAPGRLAATGKPRSVAKCLAGLSRSSRNGKLGLRTARLPVLRNSDEGYASAVEELCGLAELQPNCFLPFAAMNPTTADDGIIDLATLRFSRQKDFLRAEASPLQIAFSGLGNSRGMHS